ncbi:aldehyde dehydrogenase family protein [Paenibacillus spiritus]|uniref:Aldehyde dehydrogenase family protein n=1 Tax=Paenibacillus spiritus TaxID=2496557 RepID=A0A5J5G8Z2_9BACL|nr:aldehyde dehydrogenase family protein [Paenibacillus spiritus]KAA9004197.1 aldehyde dehydrogenase family protein [Paenibacillus spiritus]
MADSIRKIEKMYSVNPSTKQVLAEFKMMSRGEIENSIIAAAEAQKAWRRTPAPIRGEFLFKIAQLLEEQVEEWGRLVTEEVGKCLRDGIGEIQRSISFLRFFAGEGYRMKGETIPSRQPDIFSYTKQQPVGTVGVITPWNVPLAIPVWKIAPALVAGNAIVWKPAPQALIISRKFIDLLEEAGLPRNLVTMLIADGPLVSEVFAENKLINAVTFTGSTRTGRIIHQALAPRGIRFQAEMGGKNPFIILPDADLERACQDIVSGGLLDAGQRCTATSRIFVHEAVYEKFRDQIVRTLEKVKIGLPMDESSIIGPVVDQGQYDTIRRYIEIAKSEGAVLLYGEDEPEEEWAKNGYFIKPKLFDRVTQDMTIANEEIFGPVLALLQFSDLKECLKLCNSIEYGLSSSIYTKDIASAMEYIDEIESGLVHVNIPSTYSEPQMPFGGIKATGIGGFREQGSHAILFYTEWKTVYVRA